LQEVYLDFFFSLHLAFSFYFIIVDRELDDEGDGTRSHHELERARYETPIAETQGRWKDYPELWYPIRSHLCCQAHP
jgi:hypothetical protein